MTMTNHKAVAGAVATSLAVLITALVRQYLPLNDTMITELRMPLEVLISAGIGYAIVWFSPANRPKEE